VDDTQRENRERYLSGWQARMNHPEVDNEQNETRERSMGSGIAFGTALGVAIGGGFGVAFGNLALGMALGIALGVAVGLILATSTPR
jgi:hypothetical protein